MRQSDAYGRFRALHEAPRGFVMPNAWDGASAVLLRQAGFEAPGTRSLAIAFALGRLDGVAAVSREVACANGSLLAAVSGLPVNGDLEDRADNCLHGRPDLDDTIRRLVAFAVAGADVLYAPALPDLDAVRAVVHAVAPKPVSDALTLARRKRRVGSKAADRREADPLVAPGRVCDRAAGVHTVRFWPRPRPRARARARRRARARCAHIAHSIPQAARQPLHATGRVPAWAPASQAANSGLASRALLRGGG